VIHSTIAESQRPTSSQRSSSTKIKTSFWVRINQEFWLDSLFLEFLHETVQLDSVSHLNTLNRENRCFDNSNNQALLLDLIDTNGGDNFEIDRSLAYRIADIFLVCFSLGNSESLEKICNKFIPEIRLQSQAPIILVGTKLDLEEKEGDEVKRNRDEALKLKDSSNAAEYVECSAYSSAGISEVFKAALRVGIDLKTIKKKKKKCAIM
jgi:GTPase SAR1 family protein